jgi:hypothetical protein
MFEVATPAGASILDATQPKASRLIRKRNMKIFILLRAWPVLLTRNRALLVVLLVEIVEAPKRIDKSPLKKRKKLFGLPQEPTAMAG